MLRTLLKVAAGVLALILLLLGALAIVLPRFVETEEFQTSLRTRASEALGTGVEWDRAEIGLLPPRVILDSLVVGGAAEGSEEARLRADAVDLRFSLWPLLSRRLEMGSLVFRGIDLAVTRSDGGWIFPAQFGAIDASPSEGKGKGEGDAVDSSRDGAALGDGAASVFALSIGHIRLADAEILIRERTLSRVIDWRLSGLGFEATDTSEAGRYAFEFESALASNETAMGRLEGVGEVTLGASIGFGIDVDLEGARLEELVSYLPVESAKGLLSGRLEILGKASQIDEIKADLRAEELVTRIAGIDVEGEMSIQGVQRPGAVSDFNVGVDLVSGGRVTVEGTRASDGALQAKSRLDQLESSSLASLLGPAQRVSGAVTGDLSFSTRGDGSVAAFETDLGMEPFGYADDTHRLDAGALDVALEFAEQPSGRTREGYAMAGTLDGTARLPGSGPRTLAGLLDAQLDLAQADLAALPFDFSVAALPTGFLTGGIKLRGQWESRFAAAAPAATEKERAAQSQGAPVALAGVLKLQANTGGTGPIDLDARFSPKAGGSIGAKGKVTRDGVLDVTTQMEALDLELLSPFLPDDGLRVAGALSGPGRVLGPASSPTRLELDAAIAGGALSLGEYQVTGPFGAKLAIKNPLSPRRSGEADLELTNARVLYEGRFEKKAGVPAQLYTEFGPDASGDTRFESRLKLKNLDRIQIQGSLGETTQMSLTATSLDLGQAAEFVPLLAQYRASGRATLSDFSIVQKIAVPPRFQGKLLLTDAALTMPEAGRVGLVGAVVGDGNRLRTDGLKVVAGDVTIQLEGHLEDPFGAGRFAFSGRTVGTPDVNGLLSTFTSKRDTVFGPLQLEGDVSGVLSQAGSLTETLIGSLRFSVGEGVGGKLRGVSLLKTVLDQMPLLGSAVWSKPFRGGRSVDDFFSDQFEIIEGDLAIDRGSVQAKTLRLAYEGYEANLSGGMLLRDLTLDMTGELLLQSDLLAVLVGALGGDGTDRAPIKIPLARVSNTLANPKVSMTPRTLAVIPKVLIQATGLDRLKDGLEEGLGKILNPKLPRIGGNP